MNSITSTEELYHRYGKEFPYACDAIAYYIFGNSEDDNFIVMASKGKRSRTVDTYDFSSFLYERYSCWEECMEEIDSFVKSYPLKEGGVFSDVY